MRVDFDDPNFRFPKMITLKEEDFLKQNPLPADAPTLEELRLEEAEKPQNATHVVRKPNDVIPLRRKPKNEGP